MMAAFAAVLFSTFILAGCGGNAQSMMPLSPSALTGTGSVSSADPALTQSQFEALGGRGRGGDSDKGPGKKDDEDSDHGRGGDEADDDADEAEVEGVVLTVAGTCPALTITIGTQTIVTSAATAFRGGECTAIVAQSRVEVKVRQVNGSILADRVEIEDADDDDEDSDDEAHGNPDVHRSPLEGTVSSVRGACPALTFNLKGIRVTTASTTVYTGGTCELLRPNVKVVVTGTVTDRAITAATITVTRLH